MHKIGIDLGGTKIACTLLAPDGTTLWDERASTPRDDYQATIAAIKSLIDAADKVAPDTPSVGVCIPGSLVPGTGKVQNANATWINGQTFGIDLEAAVSRPVKVANDANCFALSEWVDGAAAGSDSAFGVIIGTGVGGGLVRGGHIINGPMSTGGEWGHLPLPWPTEDEFPGPECWCGRRGCMEQWISGPALQRDHHRITGKDISAKQIIAYRGDDPTCDATLNRYASRLARGLAVVMTLFDPDVVVLGGGLSNMSYLYDDLPELITPHLFTSAPRVDIRPPKYGDSSGVRGAAWLWDSKDKPV